jgi:transcriptional regulator GlxA family with amidase domain
MRTIDIVLFDGFDELDAIAPFEVLVNGGFDVRLVTVDGAGPVTASHGAPVGVDGALSGDADLVIVPGGGWSGGGARGVRAEAERGVLPRRLRELHDAGTPVASVCTGAMLLAAAGITGGRRATTHHSALADLRASGADVVEERFVDDGDVLTAGGVTAGIDLALHLVARHRGEEARDLVAAEIEYPGPPAPARTEG